MRYYFKETKSAATSYSSMLGKEGDITFWWTELEYVENENAYKMYNVDESGVISTANWQKRYVDRVIRIGYADEGWDKVELITEEECKWMMIK